MPSYWEVKVHLWGADPVAREHALAAVECILDLEGARKHHEETVADMEGTTHIRPAEALADGSAEEVLKKADPDIRAEINVAAITREAPVHYKIGRWRRASD